MISFTFALHLPRIRERHQQSQADPREADVEAEHFQEQDQGGEDLHRGRLLRDVPLD